MTWPILEKNIITILFVGVIIFAAYLRKCWVFKSADNMSHVMRKAVYGVCEQQRRRSACASAQSDQRLCCSLPR